MKHVQKHGPTSRDKGIQSLIKALDPKSPVYSREMSQLIESLDMMLKYLYPYSGERSKIALKVRGDCLAQLNKFLERYTAYPQIVDRNSKRTDAKGWELTWYWTNKQKGECFALNALPTLLELAFSKQLDRLRMCEQCEGWLFARTAEQIFCSEKCRNLYHARNPLDKARRAEWAQQKYWELKNSKKSGGRL